MNFSSVRGNIPAERFRLVLCCAILIPVFTLLLSGSQPSASVAASSNLLASTTLVISQVDGGGGGSTGTYLFDYVEIKNVSGSTQSLSGLSLYYGSATGNLASSSGNAFALPPVTLNPGQFYLVQLGTAGTAGTALPITPDAVTTSVLMSATAGKIALVNPATFPINTCGATATPCSAAQLSQIIDWVAYGAAGNGTAGNGEGGTSVNNGANITSSQGAVRKTAGCTDTDNNNLDFDVVTAPIPRNRSTPVSICNGGPTPTPSPTPTGTPFQSPTPTPTPTPSPSPTPPPSPTPTPDPNENPLVLGNPSNATTEEANENNYLMVKPQYSLSYSRAKATPNWVAWRLDSTWVGSANRQDDYRPDPALPAAWHHVGGSDYSGSGYDRGHMCPSGDRTRSVPDNSATFLMTNFIPQLAANNQGPWNDFENYCRTLASQGNEVYIFSGPVGNIGTISNGRVVVPQTTWKVVLILPNGSDDLRRVNVRTRAFGIIVPNQPPISSNAWRTYRVTVDAVEGLSGYDFFSNVPMKTQEYIEQRRDTL